MKKYDNLILKCIICDSLICGYEVLIHKKMCKKTDETTKAII